MAAALVMMLITAIVLVAHGPQTVRRTAAVAYFANSNGLFPGDEVRVLGVPVGKIDTIEPQPQRVKVSIWFDSTVQVPADVKAVILSPSLVTSRAIALMPAYTGGAEMKDNAVIPQERTAVPVEFDDFRQQLDKLTQALQPTQPGGVSPLGSFVNTAADNLRGHADPADDPCVLAVSFFCRFVPIAPDLHGDADLTKQLPPVDPAVAAPESLPPTDICRHLRKRLHPAEPTV